MTQTDVLRGNGMVSKGQLRSSDGGRGQPSVLHLLPFSNNDAAEEVAHAASIDVQESSISETRVFPVLAVTRSHQSPEIASSAGENASHDSDNNYSANQRKRLPRASSERLSRDPSIPKIRAKSEYNVRLESKPSTATLYNNNDRDPNIRSNDLEDNVNFRVRSSLKPDQVNKKTLTKGRNAQKSLLQLSDLNKKSYVMTFWYKKELSSAEMKTKMTKLDQSRSSSSSTGKSGVKLNVKELPRSKTPIVDNDPDRLNMNHVIAFLQSTDVDSRADKKKDLQNKYVKKTIAYEIDFDQLTRPALHQGQKQQIQTEVPQPRPQAEVIETNTNKQLKNNREMTNHRLPDFRPKSYPSYRIDTLKKNSVERKLEDVLQRTKNVQYSDLKTYNAVMASQSEPRKLPNSLHWRVSTDQQGEINVSTMIRNINNDTARPFRLHRFLTIVPDKVPDAETNGDGSAENKRKNAEPLELTVSQRNTVTIKANTDGTDKHYHSENRHTKVHANLGKSRLNKESSSLTSAVLSLAVKKGAHFSGAKPVEYGEEVGGRKKAAVICLPSADYDSDDDLRPTAVPVRGVTRGSYREPTQTHMQHESQDSRPKSSFIHLNEINDNLGSLTTETKSRLKFIDDPPDSGIDERSINSKTLDMSKADRIDNLVSKPSVHQDLPDDISLPSSLFLNYPAPGLSLYTSSGTWLSNKDSSDDYQKQNGRLFPSHPNIKNSLSSSSLQSFPRSQVKLALRKERDRTSVLTYMSDMEIL